MQKIEDTILTVQDISERYGLKLLHVDFTDITLLARIGFSLEMFIQIYANTKKDKLNMSLVVSGKAGLEPRLSVSKIFFYLFGN
jgi:hypothetical protein